MFGAFGVVNSVRGSFFFSPLSFSRKTFFSVNTNSSFNIYALPMRLLFPVKRFSTLTNLSGSSELMRMNYRGKLSRESCRAKQQDLINETDRICPFSILPKKLPKQTLFILPSLANGMVSSQ